MNPNKIGIKKFLSVFIILMLVFSPVSLPDSSEIMNAERFQPGKKVEFNAPFPEINDPAPQTTADFLMSGNVFEPQHHGGIHISGDITEDTTWHAEDGPVYIEGGELAEGVTLTIEAGTTIVFRHISIFRVKGILNAQGTASDPILFTYEPNEFGDNWFYFSFEGEGSSPSSLSYIELESESNGFYLEDSSPTFKHVTATDTSEFDFFLVGFTLVGNSSPRFIDITASNMLAGVVMAGDTSPFITHSTFENNAIAGIYVAYGNPNPIVNWSILDKVNLGEIEETDFLDPNDEFDFSNNWWGTTDFNEINTSIYDHNDDPTKPYVDYTPILSAPPIYLAADGNNDGVVDQEDYNLWKAHFGLTTEAAGRALTYNDGDYNEDGVVDSADYIVWRKSLGVSQPAPIGTSLVALSGAVVEDPVSSTEVLTPLSWQATRLHEVNIEQEDDKESQKSKRQNSKKRSHKNKK